MSTNGKAKKYRLYLLSIWQETGRDHSQSVTWRFGLKDPHTSQQRCFANVTALMTALLEETVNLEESHLNGGEKL